MTEIGASEPIPVTDVLEMDEFVARNREWMRKRLEDGYRRWGLGWRQETYSDQTNLLRLQRAVDHLGAALRNYRADPDTIGVDEMMKRAADVANQAFMVADKDRKSE